MISEKLSERVTKQPSAHEFRLIDEVDADLAIETAPEEAAAAA
jgi:hypothetical protein